MKKDLVADSKPVKVTNEQLSQITTLARKQFKLEQEILKTTELLKKLGEEHKQISESDLPGAMEEIDMEEFKLKGGWKISIKEDTFASIAKVNQKQAHAWLEKKGFGGIIKSEGNVLFDKGNKNQVEAFLKILNQRKLLKTLPYSIKNSIHGQTLKAFVKEQREKGLTFPDCFSIYTLKKSIIKR